MAFCLSGEVVGLHLDNSAAEAFLCNQGDTGSLSFETNMPDFESGHQAWYYSYP